MDGPGWHDQWIYTRVTGGNILSPLFHQRRATLEGRRVEILFREQRLYVQDPLRRFYFRVVVRTFGDHFRSLGQYMHDDEVHALLKEHLLKVATPVDAPEEYVRITRSTRRLSQKEMSDYVTRCMVYGQEEFGIEFKESR